MFCPAFTGLGLPALVMLRSASVETVTPIEDIAVLLAVLVSCEDVPTVTVSVMMVPAAKPAATVTTTGKVLVDPGATLGLVQLMDPVVVQVHPAGTGVSEAKVVLVGIDSVKVAAAQ